MPSAQVMDVERLLSPISEESPQGNDIREDRSPTSDYYTIKDARNTARATERTGLFDEEVRQEALAQWQPVLQKSQEILSGTSKDIEVTCWMIEAAVRLHGFTGLRDGFQVLHGLIEQFWNGLYPEPDEDGIETKVASITGLNGDGADGTLLTPIRNCPVTAESNHGVFSFFEYQQINEASRISDDDKRNERYAVLGNTLDDVNQTIAATDDQFYLNLLDDLETCNNIYKEINTLLYDHCGNDSPPSSQISSLLEEVLRSVRFLCKDIVERAKAQNQQQQTKETEGSQKDNQSAIEEENRVVTQTVTSAEAIISGPVTNREQALRQLEDIAQFFRTYEPHTPLADGIDRLVRWGRMTVSELMIELMPEETARSIFSQLTGVAMDGSSTTRYVPPPVATPAQAEQTAEIETTSKDPNEPAFEETSSDDGWGNNNSNDASW